MTTLFDRLFSFLQKSPFVQKCLSFLRRLMPGVFGTAPLSRHLQQMKDDADETNAKIALEDKFPPLLKPADGDLVGKMTTSYISYYFTTKVFIKRQPHSDEMGLDIYGNPVVNPYIADRIRNEAAALRFIREHTTIPVPTVLDLWEDNGLVYLKTSMISHGIELGNVDEGKKDEAVEKVTVQLERDIIPQLQRLRRNFIGSADPELPVVVPHMLWGWKDKRLWPKLPVETDEYVFVHSDLDRQNILVDPDTFRIICIIDWETAGFFPVDWELPKWKFVHRSKEKMAMQSEARKRQLAIFGPEFQSDD